MSALAPVGQEAAASEDGKTLCFLCYRKNLGPLGNIKLQVEEKAEAGWRKKRKCRGNKCTKVREQGVRMALISLSWFLYSASSIDSSGVIC